MSSTQAPPSVYARLNLAGEDDDSPEAEVERLLESEQNGAAAAEAEPVVVDGVRVIDVGDDYDWGFDDDDDEEEDAGTDMADRLARASAGDVGHGGARASHDERRGAPDFAIEVGAGNCGGCGAPFQCQDEARTGYVPPCAEINQ